jgi:Ca-activated chloride channel homolog
MQVSTFLAVGWVAGWVVVFLLFVAMRSVGRSRLRRKYGSAAVPRGLRIPWRAVAPAALLVAASTCLIVVVGQFRLDRKPPQGTVILAIDVSRSMDATDVEPSRLEAARGAASTFLEGLPRGLRAGVVTFAGDAREPVAPADDRRDALEAVGSLRSSRGTVIGDGLALALDAIEADWEGDGRRPAAIVLLSDGADTGSSVPPSEAAGTARSLGVPVFTVAIVGPDAGTKGSDTQLLDRIATQTGGRASAATSAGELNGVYEALGTELSADLAVGTSAVPLLVVAVLLTLGAVAVFLAPSRPR